MAFLIRLVSCVIAISSIAKAVPLPESLPQTEDSYIPQTSQQLPPQINYETFALPSSLQLPRAESNPVPFYVPELSTVMKAPQFNPQPSYYEVPIPSQDLVAPLDAVWNPENDPKYYYEVPAILSQQDSPTNSFPKKFNADLHSKTKPFASRPKQEIVLESINAAEFNAKQKSLNKVFDKMAKKENLREIAQAKVKEQEVAETGFQSGFDSEGHTQGLSPDLTASLGLYSSSSSSSPHSHSQSNNERLEFHMVGHDGPHSYKWGYDTGKGHNRQFRFEERDKEGVVKGHFGFYDKHGKLQMVNYDAHPHEGFHAEGNFGKF